jgi:hypothetical protein
MKQKSDRPIVRGYCVALFAFLFTIQDTMPSTAQTVELCREVAEVVMNPTVITRKVEKEGLKCVLLPFCCGPTWSVHPECYVMQQIEGQPQRVELPKCSMQDARFAIEQFVAQLKNPIFILSPAIALTYKDLVDLDYSSLGAVPIPDYIKVRLHRLVGQPGILFDGSDIDRAKYGARRTFLDKALLPETYGNKDASAITHDDLIIFATNMQGQELDLKCTSLALWAHELTHVFQNRRDGRDVFFSKYASDAAKYSYRDIPYEKEAYAVQDTVNSNYCDLLLR